MNWLPLVLIVIFSVAELFFLRRFIAKKETIAFKSAIVSLAFLWLIFIVSYLYQFRIPDAAYIFIIISLFMNSYFGYYLNLYEKSKRYDRIQHVIGSFSFAIFFYFFFSNLFEYGGSRAFQAFYVLLLGVFYGTLYEIIEFLSDLKNKEKMQRGLRDTNMDMVSDVIGSLAASVLAFFVF